MGPAGELRYPSCPSHKLTWAWRSYELGEFQCYDKVCIKGHVHLQACNGISTSERGHSHHFLCFSCSLFVLDKVISFLWSL